MYGCAAKPLLLARRKVLPRSLQLAGRHIAEWVRGGQQVLQRKERESRTGGKGIKERLNGNQVQIEAANSSQCHAGSAGETTRQRALQAAAASSAPEVSQPAAHLLPAQHNAAVVLAAAQAAAGSRRGERGLGEAHCTAG